MAVALLVMTAEGAAAQTVTSGGLFGATRNDAGGREKLNLQLTMAGAFDSDVPPEFQSVAGRNDLLVGNRSALVAGSTEFERNRHSVQLFGDAATQFRYVQDLDQIAVGSQHGRLGLGFRLPRRGNLEVTQAAGYSPSYLYDLLPAVTPQPPGAAVPGSPEYQIDQTESFTYTTKTALTFGSARGTLLTTTAEYGFVNYKHRTIGLPDRATYMVGTRLSKALSRKLGCFGRLRLRSGRVRRGHACDDSSRDDGRGVLAAALGDAPGHIPARHIAEHLSGAGIGAAQRG